MPAVLAEGAGVLVMVSAAGCQPALSQSFSAPCSEPTKLKGPGLSLQSEDLQEEVSGEGIEQRWRPSSVEFHLSGE